MHCQSCEQLIKSELDDLESISETKIDHQSGEGEVSFDSGKVSKEQIFEAIKKAGYDAVELESVTPTHIVIDKPALGKVVFQAGPLKVQLESKTDATGKVYTDANGQPKFEGRIENKKKANFVLPKGIKNPQEWLNTILSEVNFSQVFDQASSHDVGEQINPGVNNPIQSRDLSSSVLDRSLPVRQADRDLNGLDKKTKSPAIFIRYALCFVCWFDRKID